MHQPQVESETNHDQTGTLSSPDRAKRLPADHPVKSDDDTNRLAAVETIFGYVGVIPRQCPMSATVRPDDNNVDRRSHKPGYFSTVAARTIARTAFLKSDRPLIAQAPSNDTAPWAASTIGSVGRDNGWSAANANLRNRAGSSSNSAPSAMAMALAICPIIPVVCDDDRAMVDLPQL
jgi:hypothetical protein